MSRFRRFAARLDVLSRLPALNGTVLPTAASQLAARRLTTMSIAALALLGVSGGILSALANAIFQAGFDPLMIASIGSALGALSLIGLAATVKLRLDDQGFVAVVAVWAGSAVWLADRHPFLAGLLAVTLLVICVLTSRAEAETSGKDAEDEMSVQAAAPTSVDPVSGEGEPMVSAIVIDSEGLAVDALECADVTVNADEPLIQRVHLLDRVGFLQNLADVREHPEVVRSCRVRFNENGPSVHPVFAWKTVTLRNEGEGTVAASFAPDIEQSQPAKSPDERSRHTLALVSHELRTPLNAIIGFSDVLKTGLIGKLTDPRQEEYLDLINGAGKDLLQLVNMLLDVSKLEAGAYQIHAEPFNATRVANECVRLLSGQAEDKKVHLVTRWPDELGETIADCRAVKQVLVNLLSNAVKFTPEGGCVTVELAPLESEAGFKVVVTDTGIGMTPEQVASACEAFKQADNSLTRAGQGTGLGLALVKGLVELHGGNLQIDSDPEIGTAVTATFPAATIPAGVARLDEMVGRHNEDVAGQFDNQKGKAA